MDEGKEEENNNIASNSSWWGAWPTWLQTAKEKSSTALEFMKRDLTEFTHVVQTDAVAAVSSTAAILKEKLTVDTAESVAGKARQSITSVLETITEVFAPHRELEDTELMIIRNSEPVTMDWWQSQLYVVRKDPKTFCHEPEGPPEMYENWLESFDVSEHQAEMTEIMMSCSEVRTLYDKLVPTSVSHLEFWQRYFYRVHLLRKAEAKRADLMRRAEQISIEDVEWDQDDELNNTHHHISKQPESTRISRMKHIGDKIILKSETNETENLITKKELSADTAQIIPDEILNSRDGVKKTLAAGEQDAVPDISLVDSTTKNSNHVLTTINRENPNIQSEPSSADNSDGSRSSPIESLGKDYSTGDEWEKDFDLEINENDLIKQDSCQPTELQKEDEDGWEKWQ